MTVAPFSNITFYVKRAFDICSEKYLKNEINTIKHIAIENVFSINKLIYEVKQKNHKERINMRELKICSFDYVTRLYERIKYALRKFDINLIAKGPTNLKALIQRKIDLIPNEQIAGVYSIPFQTEKQTELSYIGMTTRKFKESLGAHMRDIKFNPLTADVAFMQQSK